MYLHSVSRCWLKARGSRNIVLPAKGELTLVRESDGKETTVHPGEAVVETLGTVLHGENRGDETTEVIVFYLSKEGLPLSVADE